MWRESPNRVENGQEAIREVNGLLQEDGVVVGEVVGRKKAAEDSDSDLQALKLTSAESKERENQRRTSKL